MSRERLLMDESSSETSGVTPNKEVIEPEEQSAQVEQPPSETPKKEGMTPEEYLGIRKPKKPLQTDQGLSPEEIQYQKDLNELILSVDKRILKTPDFLNFLEQFKEMTPEERQDVLKRPKQDDNQEDMMEMYGMGRIPKEVRGWLKNSEQHEDEIRNWLWETFSRVADTVSESRSDMSALQYAQSRVTPELRKEIDAILLMYQKYIAFSTQEKFESAMGDTSKWKAEHLEILNRRPELYMAFQLWEKYAVQKGILMAKDTERARLREELKVELKEKLKATGLYEETKPDSDKYNTKPDLSLAVEMGVRFGEYHWRTSERAAFLDTTCRGSGEFWLRRILHTDTYIQTTIDDGELKAKPEIAKRANQYIPDFYSSRGEKFWLGDFNAEEKRWGRKDDIIDPKTGKKTGEKWTYEHKDKDGKTIYASGQQNEEVRQWYKRMKNEGKIDSKGFIWDMSDCPLDKIDFKVGLSNPNAGILVSHVFKELGYGETVRNYLVSPDGFAISPFVESLIKSKQLNFSVSTPFYTDESLAQREKDIEFNESLGLNEQQFRRPIKKFRQEIIEDWVRGMREWQFKNGLSSPVSFAHNIEQLSPYNDNLIGERERKELMNEMFKVLPYWLQIPARRLNLGTGFLQLLWEIVKRGASNK